jgi:hypothetical protein
MSATKGGPGQIVRLREARLGTATRALAAARGETVAAERARAQADREADRATLELAETRAALGADPNQAGFLLALVDRRRFDHAVAKSASNDAAEAQRLCEAAEAERRAALIRAQARRDALVDHVGGIERRAARGLEQRLADEMQHIGRKG